MQLTPLLKTARFAWRQLCAAPGQAAIVILGLAVGIALTLLATSFVRDKLWPDAGVPEAERLITFEMRVRGPGGSHTEWFADTPAIPVQQGLRTADAPLGPMSKVLWNQLTLSVDSPGIGKRSAKMNAALVDPDIETLFGLRATAGNLAAALASPEGLVLTETGARKLFGAQPALGRQVSVFVPVWEQTEAGGHSTTLTVMALLPDPSHNSELRGYEAMAGFGSPPAKIFLAQESSWSLPAGKVYARMLPGATPQALGALAQALLDKQPAPEGLPADFLKGGGKWAYLRAMPLAQQGLHGAGSPQRRLQMGGLAVAALGVLALAMINFINLWSVRTLRRQREIGLRKSLGADASALALQFFVEALLVALLAGACGLLFAWWATPAFGVLMQHGTDHQILAPDMLLATGLVCLLLAALSALPLSTIALKVRAAESLAGRSHSEGRAGRWLRRGMTVLQFAAAALFTAMALIVLWQNHHAGRLDRGFQIEDRMAFDMPFGARPSQQPAILSRIQAWPEVIAAGASSDVPGRGFAHWHSEFTGPGGQKLNLQTGFNFTPGLLKLYEMPLLAGRLSADHAAELDANAAVLDRSAARALGFADPQAAIGQSLGVNSQFDGGKPRTVAAVIEDVRLETARNRHLPNVFVPKIYVHGGAISVHSRAPAETQRKLIELLQKEFPDEAPEVASVRGQQGRAYENDARFGRLIAVVSGLAVMMAAIGIYALAAYTLRLREREIVLRKLHGAGHGAVARLLAKEFAAVLLLACAIGLPIAAWLGESYLSSYVDRAPMGPALLWPLLLAMGALTLVTSAAVLRHLLAAFALRPLQALRG